MRTNARWHTDCNERTIKTWTLSAVEDLQWRRRRPYRREEKRIMDFIAWIVVGIVAGWLAGVITRSNRNIFGDLILGLIGGFIGGWITDVSIGDGNGLVMSIIVATICAVALVWIKNLVLGRG